VTCHENQENYETRNNTLRDKGFLLFLTPSALSATVSEYHAVANGAIPLTADAAGTIFGDRLTAGMRQ
jgi:hypothetical protein